MSDDRAQALRELCDRVVAAAGPGEDVEAFGVHRTSASARAFDGTVERATTAEARGVGVRLVRDGRLGFASTSDVTDDGLRWALDEARSNAALGDEDPGNVLPDAQEVPPLPGMVPDDPTLPTAAERVALVLDLERSATSRDPRARRVLGAGYGDARTAVAVVSTRGVRVAYERQDCSASVAVLAEEGEETQTGSAGTTGRALAELDLERVAAEAVERAVRVLGGRKPATATVPVVFDPTVTSTFLGVVAGGFSAGQVQKGRSLFAELLGQQVLGAGLSVVDDGRLLDGPAAAPCDDEGLPTRRTEIVSGGVLATFLHSTETAARAGGGATSTSSASRGGYGSSPGVGTANLYLDGPTTPVGGAAGPRGRRAVRPGGEGRALRGQRGVGGVQRRARGPVAGARRLARRPRPGGDGVLDRGGDVPLGRGARGRPRVPRRLRRGGDAAARADDGGRDLTPAAAGRPATVA